MFKMDSFNFFAQKTLKCKFNYIIIIIGNKYNASQDLNWK